MIEAWHLFLTQQGANVTSGRVASFGDASAERAAALEGDTLCDLSHFGLMGASGEDAMNFLQGQFSNDMRQVDEQHSQLSAYCSPKGRILAAFRVLKRGDTYLLRMPAELLPATLERLKKYVLMSKVTLTDMSDKLTRFGLAGPNAPTLLQTAVGLCPDAVDESVQAEGVTVVRVADARPRFELYGEPESMQTLWQTLAEKAKPVGASAWALLDIHAGIPNVFEPTVEAFVPQMVNLPQVNGVSFKKGCYPGQEVVARMQYLGKLKRRMYLAHADSAEAPQPGDELFAPGAESGQGTGKVVDAQPSPAGGVDLLAVVQIANAEGEVRLGGPEGARLEFLPLPYSVE